MQLTLLGMGKEWVRADLGGIKVKVLLGVRRPHVVHPQPVAAPRNRYHCVLSTHTGAPVDRAPKIFTGSTPSRAQDKVLAETSRMWRSGRQACGSSRPA